MVGVKVPSTCTVSACETRACGVWQQRAGVLPRTLVQCGNSAVPSLQQGVEIRGPRLISVSSEGNLHSMKWHLQQVEP